MKPSARIGYWTGLGVTCLAFIVLLWPGQERFHALGPVNTGHANLACQDCHLLAPGTARQQIQANLRYWLGMRTHPVAFQHQPVTNGQCLACHERPKDNHPTHRFNEPRFAEARSAIHPELCASCHREHQGVRVTMELTFCSHCHQTLGLKNDPLDQKHDELVAANDWTSCMGCHDFHGNHVMQLKTKIADALPLENVLAYFRGAPSPYSDEKMYTAKEPTHD